MSERKWDEGHEMAQIRAYQEPRQPPANIHVQLSNVESLLEHGCDMVADMLEPGNEFYVELPLDMARSLAHWLEVSDKLLGITRPRPQPRAQASILEVPHGPDTGSTSEVTG